MRIHRTTDEDTKKKKRLKTSLSTNELMADQGQEGQLDKRKRTVGGHTDRDKISIWRNVQVPLVPVQLSVS